MAAWEKGVNSSPPIRKLERPSARSMKAPRSDRAMLKTSMPPISSTSAAIPRQIMRFSRLRTRW